MSALVQMMASFFYIGYAPVASGAFGSLAGAALAWVFFDYVPVLALLSGGVGLMICRRATEVFNSNDPKEFVIDEVAGMTVSLLCLPKTPGVFVCAYVIFRILDVWKPWPIRALERIKHPTSIIWDDLGAGVITTLLMHGLVAAEIVR